MRLSLKLGNWLLVFGLSSVLSNLALALDPTNRSCTLLSKLTELRQNSAVQVEDVLNEDGVRISARNYELDIARATGLPLDEVVGISRNFHNDLVEDGSTGVFVLRDDVLFERDHNLVGAYRRMYGQIRLGDLSPGQVVELRRQAWDLMATHGGRDLINPPVRSRQRATSTVEGRLDPYVVQRLQSYGYEVTQSAHAATIRYISRPDLPDPLIRYTNELNRMVQEHRAPEEIAAFAVQELLIIHPFSNGNGRSARLIGQILYRQMTGRTLIFPESFHSELGHSLTSLVQSLDFAKVVRESNPIRTPYDSHMYFNIPQDVPATVMAVPSAHDGPLSRDRAFGSFMFGSRPASYATLPRAVRQAGSDRALFYGRPAATLRDVENIARNAFVFGRTTRNQGHRNIVTHQRSIDHEGMQSGFFQTTRSIIHARHFARAGKMTGPGGPRYGVVFVIDPRGAETLYLPEVANSLGNHALHELEQEVLFDGAIAPRRFYSAVVYDNHLNQVVQVWRNPNYVEPTVTSM